MLILYAEMHFSHCLYLGSIGTQEAFLYNPLAVLISFPHCLLVAKEKKDKLAGKALNE